MKQENKTKVELPSSIFVDRTLSVLEIISEYLKEDKEMSYHEIAELLNRDDRTIWTCVNRAKKKRKQPRKAAADKGIMIPSQIFQDRNLSVLEIMSEYLKEEKGMSYHEIAELLNRDDRTIWTCYSRAKKKRDNSKSLKTS
ncbi:MAG: sigma-70 region 4 domain-containing protein [Nanoarchaeota archaeon]|nr:sigma-70 region 4 domain-containing protein [Nanoarchaeota archaeon]MBU1704427.1 sigma-70 region 4 domain-containing protein [Nanoarchaeota archaeon]